MNRFRSSKSSSSSSSCSSLINSKTFLSLLTSAATIFRTRTEREIEDDDEHEHKGDQQTSWPANHFIINS